MTDKVFINEHKRVDNVSIHGDDDDDDIEKIEIKKLKLESTIDENDNHDDDVAANDNDIDDDVDNNDSSQVKKYEKETDNIKVGYKLLKNIINKQDSSELSTNVKQFTNDLYDNESIDPKDVDQYGVVISVPTIYISADETKSIDRVISNLRVIKYDILMELTKIAIEIAEGNKEKQLEITNRFAKYLGESNTAEYTQFIELIKWGGTIAKDLDVDEDYCDASTIGVSFDLIRNFICDPETGILKSAEPTPYNGFQLYSQLADNEEQIRMIREATNDTDFNRIQYYLAHFEKQLTFTPGYVPNQTTKLINLTFFFMTIYAHSNPITGFSSNDLKGNILSYSIDVLVRSRVIQAWQRDYNTKILLKDLQTNYDNRNYMTKISTIPTARERANTFLNLVKNKPELAQILDTDFYNRYIVILDKYKMTVADEDYYLLGSQFIIELGAIIPNNLMDIQKLNLSAL